MDQKHEYLIWREKNGFFSALDKRGNLLTWSLLTGKLVYSETQMRDGCEESLKKYEVYRADEQDITYTRNFYNFSNCSYSLLRSKTPCDAESALQDGQLDQDLL